METAERMNDTLTKADLIVIGAGPGGYEVAAHEAKRGKDVILIEKGYMGGTCLNRGCIPTKCLCAGADLIESLKNAPDFGVEVGEIKLSYGQASRRAANIVDELRRNVGTLVSRCRIVEGEASVTPEGYVSVDGTLYVANKVIIATGSEPATLPIPGAELCINSEDFLRAESLPSRLVIIGGGVIGLEFAYIANAYDAEVTVIEYCKEILPSFEGEIAKRLRLNLTAKGIDFITSAAVTGIYETEFGKEVRYTDKKGEQTVTAPAVLMAVGRKPCLPHGLNEAGIETGPRGFIVTNNDMETTRPGFYAVGDCNGRLMLAHAATAQAFKAIGENVNTDIIPASVFTHPEIAMVGKTTEQCKAEGIEYVTKKALYRANGKALASGCPDGFVKMVIDPNTGYIIGCHILGAHASDLIQEATLAMTQNVTADKLAMQTVHGHPTLSEVLAAALS